MSTCGSLHDGVFRSVKEAFIEAEIPCDDSDEAPIIVWSDSIRDQDYYTTLRPWQVVNRIPNMHVMCRKTPFGVLLMKMKNRFSHAYSFIPSSFILPGQEELFLQAREATKKTFIIKPDGGSFGSGIKILRPEDPFEHTEELAVAQDYIESDLVNGRKFDLRIYVLIASVEPLEVYVYRDGLVRLCSEPYKTGSLESQLSNVTLNMGNPKIEVESISKLISEVFPMLEKQGANVNAIWAEVDRVVLLSIFAVHPYLKAGLVWCPGEHHTRCFHVVGFDVLLDRDMKAHVLEVNYRPSLEYFRGKERRMKVSMIRDSLLLSCPFAKMQIGSMARRWFDSKQSWDSYLASNPDMLKAASKAKEQVLARSKYHRVWPMAGPRAKKYQQILAYSHSLPFEKNLPGLRPFIEHRRHI